MPQEFKESWSQKFDLSEYYTISKYWSDNDKVGGKSDYSGVSIVPIARSCYFTFVEDDFPLGVIPGSIVKSKYYDLSSNSKTYSSEKNYIIGFGSYELGKSQSKLEATYHGNDAVSYDQYQTLDENTEHRSFGYLADVLSDIDSIKNNDAIEGDLFRPLQEITFRTREEKRIQAILGGNYTLWYDKILSAKLNDLSKKSLYAVLDKEVDTFKDKDSSNTGRSTFIDVFDATDIQVSIEARQNYDEDYSTSVSVIAGNGRTLAQAREIWDFFRITFHEEKMVKSLFQEAYGLDPDDDEKLPSFVTDLILLKSDDTSIFTRYIDPKNKDVDALDEFEVLLGEQYLEQGISVQGQKTDTAKIKEAVNFSAQKFIDKKADKNIKDDVPGLLTDLDTALRRKFSKLTGLLSFLVMTKVEGNLTSEDATELNLISFQSDLFDGNYKNIEETKRQEILSKIDSPKKLYLFIVGWFRQIMWSDAYNRAWLVLKPNRRLTHYSSNPLFFGLKDISFGREDGLWDFSPVYKAWQAFIDPNSDYAKKPSRFKEFLVANASEGDSATHWFSAAFEDTKDFWDRNVGIYFTAISEGLTGLLNMFKLSMAQMGYGLAEIDNLNKQANVLNKYLNDSIYYTMGNPGTLLRAVDNPFTREYGEPVVEIREPFQRVHYLSSFTHILSNKIQENINDVATVVTAVSDGKYPVTVALDKAASPERQVEKTVETGLYFDNIRGSGFFGILHPIFHPFETVRGISKMAQGSPDELTARRVALSHLKESVKDIYTGELIVIGSPDIRPHDLVYLADVYERMYGLFEVEQVVHHFTPELGFVTSITPNALVTVNDPSRWFMSSWLASWLSLQTLRNDTRYLLSVANSRTGIISGGNVSVDRLAEALSVQMLGGVQYTHGHSALVKDIMANFTANSLPDAQRQLALSSLGKSGKIEQPDLNSVKTAFISTGVATVVGGGLAALATVATGGAALVAVGAAVAGSAIFSDAAWSGWKFIRDNILDQHGCYVQYLSRNGQPMDAGLSYNQGMVVGKYHSKALLPGILGVNSRRLIRTQQGNAYVRTDELLKNLGWKEKDIADLVRHISYENALVSAKVLQYSGIGPEKAGLNQFFKILVKVVDNGFIDGDTIKVVDILNPDSKEFSVRFEGINAAELNVFKDINIGVDGKVYRAGTFDPSSPGGKARVYVEESLRDKIFVLRVAPNSTFGSTESVNASIVDAGSSQNKQENYLKDTTISENGFGQKTQTTFNRTLGTIFHRVTTNELNLYIDTIRSVFISNDLNFNKIKETVKQSIFSEKIGNQILNPIAQYFENIYQEILSNNLYKDYFISPTNVDDPLFGLSQNLIDLFNVSVEIKIIESLYSKSTEWPLILWDEYYSDGTPATLNWEMVVSNLATVYTKSLLFNQDSVNLDTDYIGELGRRG